jgi:hypothetical protein
LLNVGVLGVSGSVAVEAVEMERVEAGDEGGLKRRGVGTVGAVEAVTADAGLEKMVCVGLLLLLLLSIPVGTLRLVDDFFAMSAARSYCATSGR